MGIEEVQRMIAAAAREAREQSAHRFLVDCRQMRPVLSVYACSRKGIRWALKRCFRHLALLVQREGARQFLPLDLS
jgi:hypothetical protein